jgi:hypothetical protein
LNGGDFNHNTYGNEINRFSGKEGAGIVKLEMKNGMW